ncbi:MAG: protein kinase [Planctomycetales bacterium]|nr:protein kinase [Planctomycetales bacterium]
MMSSPDPLAVLEIAVRNQLESILLEFDEGWRSNSLDEFGERLASHPDEEYRHLALTELVKIDLQRTWSAGTGRLLEDYLEQFPSLGTADSVTATLVVAEYNARASFDSQLALDSYRTRFPKQFGQVKRLASELVDSSTRRSSTAGRTDTENAQASVDTSRIDQLRDTKDGGRRGAIDDLPVEFGRYRILKELGSGAMGKVYLAHDSQLDRQVAIKTPSFRGADVDNMFTRFYREARAAAKLQHRNICPIYDVGEIEGRHFISMALVKGRCMSDFIKPDKLPPQQTSAILVQRLAVALAEAHKHNVIHRDLKPANIMIDLKKEPIVMDFGLAKQMDAESRVTQSGMAVGTPAYMSPEQVRGDLEDVGASADIYSLGVILYELLTGCLPFRGPIATVVYGIVHEDPAAPSTIREDIDPELEAICAKMMAKDKAVRFQSMEDVSVALKSYVKGCGQAKRPKQSASDRSTASTSESGENGLTETGALNAFFAAQADANVGGTNIEPARLSIVTNDPMAAKRSTRPRTSSSSNGNRRRRRNLVIASGFAGGIALLLGVVIYFSGGKIVLDDNSNAVVQVDDSGDVTIRTGSQADSDQVNAKNPATASAKAATIVPTDQLPSQVNAETPTKPESGSVSFIDPNVELLNEWQHGGENSRNWHLATLSPDGRRVAFRIGDAPLTISDVESKEILDIPSAMEDAISIAFSSDGRLIATGHDNKKIRLWDGKSFESVGEPFESPIEQRVLWVHLSADGTKLIAMGNDHSKLKNMSTFFTWEVSTRKLISRFQARMDEQKWADSIDASADGRMVAVVTLREGPTLWDTTTGENIPVEFEFDEKVAGMKRITGMDLSADGSRLAYGTLWGSPSYAAILDTSTGKELWSSGKQNGRVHCVQFSNDGKWLASTAGRTNAHQLSLWNVATGAEVKRWMYEYSSTSENADLVKFLSFSDDGTRLMLAGGHMPVVVWNLGGTQTAETEVEPTVSQEPTFKANGSEIRSAAQRVLDLGGRLGFVGTRGWKYALPEDEFRVNNIEFLARCKFQDADVSILLQFPELETITFWEGDLTDTGVEPLANLTQLQHLTLLTPEVSDEAVSRLRERLPIGCRFTDKRDKDKYENDS